MVVIAVDVGGCAAACGSCTARASAIINGQRKQAAQAVHRHTSHTERCVMATQRHSPCSGEVYCNCSGPERACESSQQYHTVRLFTRPLPHVSILSLSNLPFSVPLSRNHDCHETPPPPPHPLQRPAKLPYTINVPSTVADIVTAPAHPSTSHTVFPVIPILGYTPSRNERIVA